MLLENSPTGQYVCTRRNRCGVSVMDKLPQEILVAILSYLPLNEILQTALVCKSWNAAQSEALSRSGAHVEVHQSVFVTDILCSIKVADIAGFIRSRLGHSINRVNIFCKRNFQMFAELSFPVVTTLGLDIAVLKLFVQSYSRSHARLVESLLIIGIHDSPEGPLPLVARHFPNLVRLELDLALGSNIKPLELFPRLQVFNVRVFSRERDERPLFPLPLNLTSLRDFIIRYEHIGNLTDIKAECLDHVFAMAPALEMSTVTNSQEYISEKVLISLLRASRSGFLSSLKHLILKFHIESPHRWLDLISDILHTGNLLLESVRVANSIYNEHLTRCLRQQKNLKVCINDYNL